MCCPFHIVSILELQRGWQCFPFSEHGVSKPRTGNPSPAHHVCSLSDQISNFLSKGDRVTGEHSS